MYSNLNKLNLVRIFALESTIHFAPFKFMRVFNG